MPAAVCDTLRDTFCGLGFSTDNAVRSIWVFTSQERQMKTPKVSLSLKICRPNGADVYAEPAWSCNGSLRAGYSI